MRSTEIKRALKKFIIQDDDFIKANKTDMPMKEAAAYFLDGIENIRDYILSKPYIDVSWLKLKDGSFIDLDALYDYFKELMEEMGESKK